MIIKCKLDLNNTVQCLTPSLPSCQLKRTGWKSVKCEIVKAFVFISRFLGCKGISVKMHSTESRFVVRRTGKYTVCRRLDVHFSPDILQAGAVKGLIYYFIVRTY